MVSGRSIFVAEGRAPGSPRASAGSPQRHRGKAEVTEKGRGHRERQFHRISLCVLRLLLCASVVDRREPTVRSTTTCLVYIILSLSPPRPVPCRNGAAVPLLGARDLSRLGGRLAGPTKRNRFRAPGSPCFGRFTTEAQRKDRRPQRKAGGKSFIGFPSVSSGCFSVPLW
jgi:hypothetical protein